MFGSRTPDDNVNILRQRVLRNSVSRPDVRYIRVKFKQAVYPKGFKTSSPNAQDEI
jgi:hypothetical protein